jgi:DNA-binding transcriptional MerR regulator
MLYFRCPTQADMPELAGHIDIPKRALFKAAEVCDLVKVQPYVLRSWEAEFPDLGVSKTAGSARVYRREDVEQVARIKHLLLVEGLTLAGARRRLEEETAPVGAAADEIDELIGRNVRERLVDVKRGLRSILDLLAGHSGVSEFRLVSVVAAKSATSARRAEPAGRSKPSRGKPSAARHAPARGGARRKRSA